MSDFPDGTYPVNVRNAVLDVNVTNSSIDVNVKNTSINVVVDSGTIDANITNTSINVVVQSGSIDANITNASINVVVDSGTIDANITNASLDVNVLGGTIDANITNATLDVNVKNSVLNVQVSGQASVSIDNASVYLNVQNEKYAGELKYFDFTSDAPDLLSDYAGYGVLIRNARGFLKDLRIKVKNLTSSNQTLTFCLSIDPTKPPIFEKNFTVPADLDGEWTVFGFFNIWWSYDTLFIYVKETNTNVQFYAKNVGWASNAFVHYSVGVGNTNYRIGITILKTGSHYKTIPVSGTVNTINIPNKTSESSTGIVYIDYGEEKTLVEIEGTGVVKYIMLWCNYRTFYFTFYVDDELLSFSGSGYTVNPSDLNLYDPDKLSNRVKLLRYDDTNKQFTIEWLVEIPFRKSFKITAAHGSTSQQEARVLYCIYEKLS